MIFIYDLILNWYSLKKYEFFEWEDSDEVEYVKKIPIFKVDNFDDIFNNNIRVNNDFLMKIYNKSEVYGSKKVEKVEYSCVFCNKDLTNALAVEFNCEGYSIYKSMIYFYDLDDVLSLGKKIDVFNLNYEIVDKNICEDIYLTREEQKKKRLLVSEINNSYNNNDIDKLKYFYYELFDEEEDNISIIYDKLISSLNNNFDYKHEVIYDVIKMPNF